MTRKVSFLLIGFFLLTPFAASVAEDERKMEPHFVIKGYQVEGNTLIPSEKLDQLLSVFTGPGKNFEAVQKARRAVEIAYYNKGLTAVQVVIPEQILKNGFVRLKVIEFNVAKIKTEGNRFFDEANILNSLPALQQGKSPIWRSFPQISRWPMKVLPKRLTSSSKTATQKIKLRPQSR